MPDIKNAITIDVVTKEWEGTLPKRCSQVALQWLNADGEWEPPISRLLARDRANVVERIENLVRTGPLKFTKYRLVPYAYDNETTNDNSTEDSMKKTKKSTGANKVSKTSKKTAELVAGLYRAGSNRARIYEILTDGKPHKFDTVVKTMGFTGPQTKNPRALVMGFASMFAKVLNVKLEADKETIQLAGKATTKPAAKSTSAKSDKPNGRTAEVPANKKSSKKQKKQENVAPAEPGEAGVSVE